MAGSISTTAILPVKVVGAVPSIVTDVPEVGVTAICLSRLTAALFVVSPKLKSFVCPVSAVTLVEPLLALIIP